MRLAHVFKACYRIALKLQRLIPVLIFLCLVCAFALGIYVLTGPGHDQAPLQQLIMDEVNKRFPKENRTVFIAEKPSLDLQKLVKKQTQHLTVDSSLNYDVHIFYYPWYGDPTSDGSYIHWNHQLIQHWNAQEALKWPSGAHVPPDDIASNFYPWLGPYSSRNRTVIDSHMQQIHSAGVGVLALSWYPPDKADDNGKPWDEFVPTILNIADKYHLKVCFHIEPYKDRTVGRFKDDITLIIKKYGNHSALYRRLHKGRHLPLFYVYDSYLLSATEWSHLLKPGASFTIRNTAFDGIFIGLLTEHKRKADILSSGFDGFYTYFASTGFTDGSSIRLWGMLNEFGRSNNLLFIPSVGPGYIDTRVRPWNGRNTKGRQNGGYYERMFGAAVKVKPPIVSITSFNEWHEGTQIERAMPKQTSSFNYLDYGSNGPDFYLKLTKKWVGKFLESRRQ